MNITDEWFNILLNTKGDDLNNLQYYTCYILFID